MQAHGDPTFPATSFAELWSLGASEVGSEASCGRGLLGNQSASHWWAETPLGLQFPRLRVMTQWLYHITKT